MTVNLNKIMALQKETETEVEYLLYGTIVSDAWWSDEVGLKQIANDLATITKPIKLRINSYGGELFAGQALYSLLKNHAPGVTTIVDGVAASAASVIAMAGNPVIMPKNSLLMIHNSWTYTSGNADELEKTAEDLRKADETLFSVYKAKAGEKLSDEKLRAMLKAETWLTAEEALEYGLIDKVDESVINASIKDKCVVFNGLRLDEKFSSRIPENIKAVLVENGRKPEPEKKENVKSMTPDEIKSKFPDACATITAEAEKAAYAKGVEDERSRIKNIEDLAVKGHEKLVTAAKFETPISAEAMAVQIVKAEKGKKVKVVAELESDAKELDGIEPDSAPSSDEADKKKEEDIVAAGVAAINARRK